MSGSTKRDRETKERFGHVRRLMWWNMPVSVDASDAVGRSMLRTSVAWFVSLFGIVIAVALVLA